MPYMNPYLPQQPQYAPYQPQGYMTAGTSPMLAQQQQQPVHGFVYVTGLEGAKAYQLPPNSEMPLFNSTGDVMYIKTTDGAGFPTIKVCKVKEMQSTQDAEATEYVTHDELDRTYRDLTEQLERVKEALYGPVPATTAAGQPAAWQDAGVAPNDGRQPAKHASAADT